MTCSDDKLIKIWDLNDLRSNQTKVYSFVYHHCSRAQPFMTLKGANSYVVSLDQRNDSLLSCDLDSKIVLWDMRSGKCAQQIQLSSTALSVKFVPGCESLVLSGNTDGMP